MINLVPSRVGLLRLEDWVSLARETWLLGLSRNRIKQPRPTMNWSQTNWVPKTAGQKRNGGRVTACLPCAVIQVKIHSHMYIFAHWPWLMTFSTSLASSHIHFVLVLSLLLLVGSKIPWQSYFLAGIEVFQLVVSGLDKCTWSVNFASYTTQRKFCIR